MFDRIGKTSGRHLVQRQQPVAVAHNLVGEIDDEAAVEPCRGTRDGGSDDIQEGELSRGTQLRNLGAKEQLELRSRWIGGEEETFIQADAEAQAKIGTEAELDGRVDIEVQTWEAEIEPDRQLDRLHRLAEMQVKVDAVGHRVERELHVVGRQHAIAGGVLQ